MKTVAICFALTCGFSALPGFAQNNEMNQGVEAYKSGHYAEAVQHFEQALRLDPGNQNAELYLATAYYVQWVPGATATDNSKNYDLAQQHFKNLLEKNSRNDVALAMMASMSYSSAMAGSPEQKAAALEESRKWNQRRIEADPRIAEPYYYLGVIDWAKSYTPVANARTAAHMEWTEHGPLKDVTVRAELKAKYLDVIEDGISNLTKCLAIDHEQEDAMTYLNLLLRTKSALEDSNSAAEADTRQADIWVQKALEIKQKKAARSTAVVPQ